ncbi:hypothetical protein LXL04_010628 [Taraxacum kok-saghyz]
MNKLHQRQEASDLRNQDYLAYLIANELSSSPFRKIKSKKISEKYLERRSKKIKMIRVKTLGYNLGAIVMGQDPEWYTRIPDLILTVRILSIVKDPHYYAFLI